MFDTGLTKYLGHEVTIKGKPLLVVKTLAAARNQTATERQLFDAVWGADEPRSGDTVRSAIRDARSAIRKSLDGKCNLPVDPIPCVDRGQDRTAWRLEIWRPTKMAG